MAAIERSKREESGGNGEPLAEPLDLLDAPLGELTRVLDDGDSAGGDGFWRSIAVDPKACTRQ
jgi:hypothetical protein